MRSKSIFLYVDIWFDLQKCKFVLKDSPVKCWFCFCLFLPDTKIIFGYNFGAPLCFTATTNRSGIGCSKYNWLQTKLKVMQIVHVINYTLKQPPEVFYKKVVLKNFAKFTKKHKKRHQPCRFIKKRLWHRCFPVTFVEYLRTPFINISGRLLLYIDGLVITISITNLTITSRRCFCGLEIRVAANDL